MGCPAIHLLIALNQYLGFSILLARTEGDFLAQREKKLAVANHF